MNGALPGAVASPLRNRFAHGINRVESFFSDPASALPLAVLRILASLVLIIQALLLSPDLFELYGNQGLLQGPLNNYLIPVLSPCVLWFQTLLAPAGISPNQTVAALFVFYVGALGTLLIGYRTRLSAILVWFFHFTLIYSTGSLSAYGVDSFAHIFLFYFMFMPVGESLSFDVLKKASLTRSSYHRLALRLLQFHLCLAYFVAGAAKALGPQWRDGEAIWRAMMMPDFAHANLSWLAGFPWLAKMIAWGTVFFETTYPVFVWPRKTRAIWITVIIMMHLGISVVMGLKTFGALMICLNLALFAIPAE